MSTAEHKLGLKFFKAKTLVLSWDLVATPKASANFSPGLGAKATTLGIAPLSFLTTLKALCRV